MILQRLVEHYDRLEASGAVKLAQPGFSQQKISFCIVLEADGRLNSFEDMRRQDGRTLQPRTMIVPGKNKSTGKGFNPVFLWDNADYLLGWNKDSKKLPRAAEAFATSRAMYLAQEAVIDIPAYSAVCNFFRYWSPDKAAESSERLKEVAGNFGVFRIAGKQRYLHEVIALAEQQTSEQDTKPAICLVTGAQGFSARLHEPKIKGVQAKSPPPGGATLVSFNESAFESYNKEQSHNAPVSPMAVFKYTNALNSLLNQNGRRVYLGDATVVFWADHAQPTASALEDCFAMLLAARPDLQVKTFRRKKTPFACGRRSCC